MTTARAQTMPPADDWQRNVDAASQCLEVVAKSQTVEYNEPPDSQTANFSTAALM